MSKKRRKSGRRIGLQAITLCISTAMVLILLGMVVTSVLTAQSLCSYVKENLSVTMVLSEEVTDPQARQMTVALQKLPYVHRVTYVSKEQVLKEQTAAMGTDPSEFIGENPFVGSMELQLKADYANKDSLKWITKNLKADSKVTDITYPQDLMDSVNDNLQRINTMKLVGPSWGFIRWPFVRSAMWQGLLAAVLADAVLAGGVYALYMYEPDVLVVLTWQVMAITGVSVLLFGLLITLFCSWLSVNKFLRMKAGDLYKI